MRQKVRRNVQEAFYAVVHDYPAGVPALAAELGMQPGTLYNKANSHENDGGHHKPTLSDAVIVSVITGDPRILQALCLTLGHVCYQLPDMSGLTTDALLTHITKTEAAGGDFYRALNDALAGDESISTYEFEQIESRAHDWVSAILEGVERLREMSE